MTDASAADSPASSSGAASRYCAAVNAVKTPEGKEQLFKLGFVATGTSPEELARAQKRDFELWGEAAKLSGFKPES